MHHESYELCVGAKEVFCTNSRVNLMHWSRGAGDYLCTVRIFQDLMSGEQYPYKVQYVTLLMSWEANVVLRTVKSLIDQNCVYKVKYDYLHKLNTCNTNIKYGKACCDDDA